MSESNTKRLKAESLVCEKYVSIDSNGNLDFKDYLKFSINNRDVSPEDAELIVLSLMYGVINYGWDYNNIRDEMETLVLKVEEYNLDNQHNLKMGILFFNDYSVEEKILQDYIAKQTPQKEIKDLHEISSNNNTQTNKLKKQIKNNLNHLSREDLCYILGSNPELSFEKEKPLKNRIADEFLKYPVDVERLKNSSSEDFKKYLNILIEEYEEDESDEEIIEIHEKQKNPINQNMDSTTKTNLDQSPNISDNLDDQLIPILEKAKEFNELTFEDMVLFKSDYADVYEKAISIDYNQTFNDIDKFIYYFSHFDEVNDAMQYVATLRKYEETFDDFFVDLNEDNISNSKLINKYENPHILASKINKYHIYLKNKLTEEFRNLNDFIKSYEDLKGYSDINEFNKKQVSSVNVSVTLPKKFKKVKKSDISKIELERLLEKVRVFNNKPLQGMLESKSDYSAVYRQITKRNLEPSLDILKFTYYFSHFDEIEDFLGYVKILRRSKENINNFFREFNNEDYSLNSGLTKKYKNLYKLASISKDYHFYLTNKIREEFTNLNHFLVCYHDLERYERISEANKKRNLEKLLNKISDFNNKTLQGMLESKSEYVDIYQKIIKDDSKIPLNEDVNKFTSYFSHFDEIENAVSFINKLKGEYGDNLEKVPINTNDTYLSYSDVGQLIIDLKYCYNSLSKINDFPYFLRTKITNQFSNLIDFIEYFKDLEEYVNFDEINEDNPKLYDNAIYKRNHHYIEKGVKKYRKFFEKIYNDKSLDDDQIRAVLTDNDATQIIAGAGTGKTLTLQGKVKFLIEEMKVPSEDILCISYSRASKKDLKDKIEKTIGKTNIKVKTFHGVGSKILRINEEDFRVKEDALERAIDLYFKNVVFQDQELMQSIVTFFSSYFKNTESQLNNNSSHQTIKSMIHAVDKTVDYDEMRVQDENNITVDREYVKSVEELIIANFLYIHGIDYIYEKKYTVENEFYEENLENYLNFLFVNCEYVPRDIQLELYKEIGINIEELEFEFYPDFYLPVDKIYMEHFGVDRNCQANWLKTKKKRKNYKKVMNHKIKIFNENNTRFIDTYSYYNQEGRLLERLEEKLRENGVEINDVDYKSIYNELILNGKLKEYNLFKRVISSFINLFKGNGLYLDENGNDISKVMFKKFNISNEKENKGDTQKRNRTFLKIIEEIYEYYHNILKESGKIDFNDMINNATIALKNGAKIHKYKYIIVDEYQDTSHMRYKLLKELQKRTNAKITVVGDDWQSIYGFTGCDIHLFSDFKEYFKSPSIVKIQNTYRNSQALIDIAGNFIQENPHQIKKKLKSTNVTYKKPLKLARYTDPIDEILMFIYILKEINKKAIKTPEKTEVLVLGRNNFDINEILSPELFIIDVLENETKIIPKFEYMNFDLSFRTIHKSKGLEADYVILLNLNDKLAGFPNKIENDPILDYVTINKEECNFAEERRLFYVALTRTLNDIYLLAPEKDTSEFILELEAGNYILDNIDHDLNDENLYKEIQENLNRRIIPIPTGISCPNCGFGEVKLIFNTIKDTKFFRCSERCGWDGGWYYGSLKYLGRVKVCDECHGMIVVKTSRKGTKYTECNLKKYRHNSLKRMN